MKRFTMAIAAAAFAAALAVSAFAQQGSTAQPATPATPAAEPAKAAPAERPAHKGTAHAMHKTDINSASREDLMKLPGITDAVADKIIAARPFKSRAELTSKKVLTAKEYAKIRSMVIAHQSAESGTASK